MQNASMDLFESELRVIAVAQELAASLGSDPNHSVAVAAMDTTGNLHTAVNVYHFTGGPCAELVVMGAAAAASAGPLLTIAAAGDRGRGLIPPCGRCRQVILDLHPDVLVAVPGSSGPQLRPIRKLLPEACLSPDARAAASSGSISATTMPSPTARKLPRSVTKTLSFPAACCSSSKTTRIIARWTAKSRW